MKYISPLFSNEKKNKSAFEANGCNQTLVSTVESFIDLDIAKSRIKALDRTIISRFEKELNERLASESINELTSALSGILAEIKAEMHYLTAAYLEELRYQDPCFNFHTPSEDNDKSMLSVFEVDLRGQITGGNWYYAEEDGRWAGPDSESSLLFPALDKGAYRIDIEVVDEIEGGIIEGMELFVNGSAAMFTRSSSELPMRLESNFVVGDDYKFPFWSLKFCFRKLRSPASINGSDDHRILAIRVASVRFTKVTA